MISSRLRPQRALGLLRRNHSCGVVATDVPLFTVPSECYHEKSFFDTERKKIFNASWQLVGHRNALLPEDGSFVQVDVAGESIVLVRNPNDAYAAYHNVCPHRAHELVAPNSKGKLKSKVMTCPNHGWSFKASNGELVKARFSENAVHFCANDHNLNTVRIKEVAGLLFVNLDAEGDSSVKDVFGEDVEEVLLARVPGLDSKNMRQLAVKEAVIDANWKIMVDNFLECYHCDIAHKAFVDMVDLSTYKTVVKPHHVMFDSVCKPENKAYNFSPNDPLQGALFCWLWPNSVVYSAPGQPNMSILQFIPLTSTTTLRRSERFALLPPDGEINDVAISKEEKELAAQAEARVNYLNQILMEEDTSICESVQRGVQSSAYRKGRLMVASDSCSVDSSGSNEKQCSVWHTEVAVAQFHHLLRHYTEVK